MITELQTVKTATFYKIKKPLTNKAISNLFKQLRSDELSPSRNHFLHIRENDTGARWSSVSFSFERKPPFLDESTTVRERVWGFILLVEYMEYFAVFKSRLELPSTFVTSSLERINPELVTTVVAQEDSIFERMRMRNMSMSKHAMRTKTLEASDLANVVGPAGVSRYVPQVYRLRSKGEYYSATPSTGRISQRSDPIKYRELLSYSRNVIDRLVAPPAAATSPFIRTFARALDLGSTGSTPVTFSVDITLLADAIYEDPAIRLVKRTAHGYVSLSKDESDRVLNELSEPFTLQGTGNMFNIIKQGKTTPIGAIAINKTRIALRTLNLPLSSSVEVESTKYLLGQDPNRQSLRTYIDRNNSFIILFDDISLAYIDGSLFRDEVFSTGGGSFLRYLKDVPMLAKVTSEKGTFSATHTKFDADSTFGVIVNYIANGDDVLVCDDLNDEWADFIGLGTTTNPTRVTFYHAKHDTLTLGASAFHISVSQAIKNLGRMGLDNHALAPKFARWRSTYNNDGYQTAIQRNCKGDQANLEIAFEQVRTAPDTIRHVAIVTSSLSKSAVNNALQAVANGEPPNPYFVQLYWLLMSFFSACAEVGAFGYVLCQP